MRTAGGGGDDSPAPVGVRSCDARGTNMLRQFLVGGGVGICNIVIHALVMAAVVRIVYWVAVRESGGRATLLTFVMVATVVVLMIAHISEVLVWSLAYAIVDAAPAGTDLVDFAFVNYTTLGYGDVTPAASWRLLGPIT